MSKDRSLIGVVVFAAIVSVVEGSLYTVLAPLLPALSRGFRLDRQAVGVLVAAYPLGVLFGSGAAIGAGARRGVRRGAFVGLVLLAIASAGFGLAQDVVQLDLARFAQGAAGAWCWTISIAWLAAMAPERRRGGLIGTVLSLGLAGALLGPVLGALATVTQRGLLFGVLALLLAALSLCALALALPAQADEALSRGRVGFRQTVADSPSGALAVSAVFAGLLGVLAPLQLAHAGLSGASIGLVFAAAVGTECLASAIGGRWFDRGGASALRLVGLLSLATAAVLLSVLHVGWQLAVVVMASGVCFGALSVLGLVSVIAEAALARIDYGVAASVAGLTWALGQVVGAMGGSLVARLSSTGVAYGSLALLALGILAKRSSPTISSSGPAGLRSDAS